MTGWLLRMPIGLTSIALGAAIGLLISTLVAAEIFSLAFGMDASSAEGTKDEFYLILMTFNGAILGFLGGGFSGLMLARHALRAKASTDESLR